MSLQLVILSLLFIVNPSHSSPFTTTVASSSAFVHGNGNNNITTQQKQRHQIIRPNVAAAFSQRRGVIIKNEKRQNNDVFQLCQFPKMIGCGGGTTAHTSSSSSTTAAAIRKRNNNAATTTKSPFALFASSSTTNDNNDTPPPPPSSNNENKNQHNIKKNLTTILSITTLTTLLLLNRQYLPTPSQIRTALVSFLDHLASLGTPGLIIYALSLAAWEMTLGITTPVETAAGMAFGIPNGILASSVGKISGAIASYVLGKYILSSKVHKALQNNEMLDLIEDDVQSHPLRTALIWRFSPLPEFVKNYGLSILEPLKTRVFVAAVMLHGLPFTCLWTCLGNETGLLLRGVVDGPSRTLKVLVSGVSWFGFLVSPTLVGMWVKGLRDKQIAKHKKEEEEDYLFDDASFL